MLSIRANELKGSENLADHVLPGMFKCKTLQVVSDRDFMIIILRLLITLFCSNA